MEQETCHPTYSIKVALASGKDHDLRIPVCTGVNADLMRAGPTDPYFVSFLHTHTRLQTYAFESFDCTNS